MPTASPSSWKAAGIRSAAIHGNKSQGARVAGARPTSRKGRVTALVATEVAARGLDIKELPYVVNYELPNVPEDYVHRIGRTARAGGSGAAVSLVAPDEAPLLRDIEQLLKRTIPVAALPTFKVSAPLPAEKAREVSGGTHRQGHRPHGSFGGQRRGGGRSHAPSSFSRGARRSV